MWKGSPSKSVQKKEHNKHNVCNITSNLRLRWMQSYNVGEWGGTHRNEYTQKRKQGEMEDPPQYERGKTGETTKTKILITNLFFVLFQIGFVEYARLHRRDTDVV